MTFVSQFGINNQSYVFQRLQIAVVQRARAVIFPLRNVLGLIYSKLYSKSLDYIQIDQPHNP